MKPCSPSDFVIAAEVTKGFVDNIGGNGKQPPNNHGNGPDDNEWGHRGFGLPQPKQNQTILARMTPERYREVAPALFKRKFSKPNRTGPSYIPRLATDAEIINSLYGGYCNG